MYAAQGQDALIDKRNARLFQEDGPSPEKS